MTGLQTISIALFQPDIAPNVGAIIRLGACLGAPVHIIEPCGFPFSLHAVRRQAMDYASHADIRRHDSWERFRVDRPIGRLIALTTRGERTLWSFDFRPGDILLLGRESAGLPEDVRATADARLAIPVVPPARSLNVGMAAAIALAEAQRQIAKGAVPGQESG